MKADTNKTFIIAEAGVNHNGSLKKVLKLIDVAASAGANAIKFQTFKAENLATDYAPKAQYQNYKSQKKETHLAIGCASGSSPNPMHVVFHALKSGGKVVVNNDLYVLKSYITICLQKQNTSTTNLDVQSARSNIRCNKSCIW